MREGRAIYVGAERIDDVTRHPAFRNAARTIADLYEFKADPQRRELFSFDAAMRHPQPRIFTGSSISCALWPERYPCKCAASIDVVADRELKRLSERWWRTSSTPALDLFKLYKLIGSEFAGPSYALRASFRRQLDYRAQPERPRRAVRMLSMLQWTVCSDASTRPISLP